jgi:2,4-dienoyl-CoA reductase-like NADH-dependent reductase (Old Yellow Enzyme family)
MASLDEPLRLPSGLVLPNRIAKSAMTEALGDCARLPSAALHRVYERWSSSGAGLLVTGNVGVDEEHPVRARDVIAGAGVDLAPFSTWARIAKSGGAAIVMQLNHGGRQTPRIINPRPLGPSTGAAVKMMHAFGEPRQATEDEIRDVVRRFGDAAALADRAGFDGVQVHAAHGYLLNQFLSPDVNRRDDSWGGDVRGRSRLLVECVRAARAAVGSKRAVMVKLNSADLLRGGFTEDDALEVVGLLDAESIDLLEISGGRYENAASFGPAAPDRDSREAYFLAFARRAREATSVPLMLTGGLRTRALMDAVLAEGVLDVVGVARPMALVPDYPRRLLAGGDVPRIAPRRLGVDALESAAELAWYSSQLARLGAGGEADQGASPWRALLSYVATDALEGLLLRLSKLRGGGTPPALPEPTRR